jgi:hypothetical protein
MTGETCGAVVDVPEEEIPFALCGEPAEVYRIPHSIVTLRVTRCPAHVPGTVVLGGREYAAMQRVVAAAAWFAVPGSCPISEYLQRVEELTASVDVYNAVKEDTRDKRSPRTGDTGGA